MAARAPDRPHGATNQPRIRPAASSPGQGLGPKRLYRRVEVSLVTPTGPVMMTAVDLMYGALRGILTGPHSELSQCFQMFGCSRAPPISGPCSRRWKWFCKVLSPNLDRRRRLKRKLPSSSRQLRTTSVTPRDLVCAIARSVGGLSRDSRRIFVRGPK
jgi:hypothetical protein